MSGFSSRETNKVTLLHKGLGPRLFQYKAEPYNDTLDSARSSVIPPPKRIVVKCVETLEANSMFTKRLRERNPKYVGATSCCGSKAPDPTLKLPKVPKERTRSSSNVNYHKPRGFPPPHFMPRWNPRKMDRTYLDKMVLEDPWSLPPEQRAELQKKTGLRLKSISKYYQFKVGMNLVYGEKAINGKCNCSINYCDHCNKSHLYRCPLHMQTLDPLQANCKTEMLKLCPFVKHPEDMTLEEIDNVSIYISEVVRRLKAGEINEAPTFPTRFKHSLLPSMGEKAAVNIPSRSLPDETLSAMELAAKKVPTDNTFTQTEPFSVDIDMKSGTMDNLCQTHKRDKAEPMMLNGLKCIENQLPFKSHAVNKEMSTQVGPNDIRGFLGAVNRFVEKFTRMIVDQSFREICDEVHLREHAQKHSRSNEHFNDLLRSIEFSEFQENFRHEASEQERTIVVEEERQARIAEERIAAIAFSQNLVSTIPTRVMEVLRQSGNVVDTGLGAIQIALKDELNDGVKQSLDIRMTSVKLIDDMTAHAIRDLDGVLSNIEPPQTGTTESDQSPSSGTGTATSDPTTITDYGGRPDSFSGPQESYHTFSGGDDMSRRATTTYTTSSNRGSLPDNKKKESQVLEDAESSVLVVMRKDFRDDDDDYEDGQNRERNSSSKNN